MYSQKIAIVVFLKSTLSGMHHRTSKTYMYINFQQNRVSRSVKTVHTNLFAKNCKLHKFAACNYIRVPIRIGLFYYVMVPGYCCN